MSDNLQLQAQRAALDCLNWDCWWQVMQRVDINDLRSCSETCVTFKDILEPTACAWKFHEVLPLVFSYLVKPRANQDQADAAFLASKPWEAVWNCRKVCGLWRDATDLYLEEHSRATKVRDVEVFYTFWQTEKLNGFLEKFQNHTGNPFIGRQVRWQPPPIQNNQQRNDAAEVNFIPKMYEMAERFGDQIWDASLIENPRVTNVQNYTNLQRILSNMPNVRYLYYTHNDRMPRLQIDQDPEELNSYIAANPLPVLPALKNLHQDPISERVSEVILEKYCPQLTILTQYHTRSLTEGHLRRMSLLQKLYLERVDANDALTGLRGLQSPLQTLTICLTSNHDAVGYWKIDQFLENIQHLPVKFLEIGSNGPFAGEQAPFSPQLKMGTVTKVTIDAEARQFGELRVLLNFLQCFPNLNEVKFLCSDFFSGFLDEGMQHPNGMGEVVKVREHLLTHSLYLSNIWDLLPKLNLFAFRNWNVNYTASTRQKYTRQEYDYIRNILAEA